MSEELRERIERLERRELARAAAIAYAEAVDAGDLAAVAAVFTEDATLTIPSGTLTGRVAIVDFFRSRLTGSVKRHFLSNVVVTDGDPLHVRSYYLFTSREKEASGFGWGHYRDDVVVSASGHALLSAKVIEPDLAGSIDEGWRL